MTSPITVNQTVFAYHVYCMRPVKGLFWNWVRLDRQIAVSNRSYNQFKITVETKSG